MPGRPGIRCSASPSADCCSCSGGTIQPGEAGAGGQCGAGAGARAWRGGWSWWDRASNALVSWPRSAASSACARQRRFVSAASSAQCMTAHQGVPPRRCAAVHVHMWRGACPRVLCSARLSVGRGPAAVPLGGAGASQSTRSPPAQPRCRPACLQGQVLVRVKLRPVNPADVFSVQGEATIMLALGASISQCGRVLAVAGAR